MPASATPVITLIEETSATSATFEKRAKELSKQVCAIHDLLTAQLSVEEDTEIQLQGLFDKLKNRKLPALAFVASEVLAAYELDKLAGGKRPGRKQYATYLVEWVRARSSL